LRLLSTTGLALFCGQWSLLFYPPAVPAGIGVSYNKFELAYGRTLLGPKKYLLDESSNYGFAVAQFIGRY
jgi:hypothetical protein